MSAAQQDDEEGGAGRKARGGRIPQDVQQQARQKESPVVSELLVAARKGLTERVVQLLQQDTDGAAVTDKHGRTCLHLACISGHLRTALAILQSGALAIDSTTKRGHTPLHESCQEGHIHLSLLLISLGASLHARSREGWTPLMCACSRGHLQLASTVVAAGGEINDSTRLGLTPLHIAAWKGHTAVVKMLLSHGCDPSAVAHNNKTAQQLASEEEHKETVTVLKAATAKVSQEPAYRISFLEGQLRLCQEKLAEAITHSNQVLMAERHHREERVLTLQRELEQEKAKVAALEAQIEQMKGVRRERAVKTEVRSTDVGSEEDTEDPLSSAQKQVVISGSIIKSASSSNLLAPHTPSTAGQAVNTLSHLSSQHGERRSITDMVSECLRNPSSMANIRSNLKADNLTPKIQRKFYHKTTSASLPGIQAVTSPLARDGVRAGDSLSSSQQSCNDYKDK